jgi:hypothetical protein
VIVVRAPAKDSTVVTTGLPSMELSWTVSDNVGVAKVTLNDAEITGTDGAYTKAVALHDGDNTFEIKAYDAAGNAGKKTVVITRPADLSKPGITPPSDQTVGADVATLKLTWKITNSHKATKITLNGTDVAVGPEISSEVGLKPGPNAFIVVVTEASGATVTETVIITRTVVVVLPSIAALTDRAVGSEIDTTTLTWTITNSDKAKSGTLNGEPIVVGASITKLVKLDPGPNLFKLTLQDSSGTEVSSSVTVVRAIDTALLGVSKPSDRSVSPETESDTLTWTVYNSTKAVSATLNDKPIAVGATIGARVSLVAGNNLFILVLKGSKGDTVADTVIVARAADVTGPSIVWVAPATKTHAVEATVTSYAVQVKVTDASGVDSVWLNGALTKPSATGEYAMALSLPKPDGNPVAVVVVARDTKGNASTDTVTVTRKVPDGTNKPIIKLLKPAKAEGNTLPYDSSKIRIEAEITDALLAIDPKSVTIGGVLATATGSVYAAEVNVPATGKATTITIKAANANEIASTLDVMVTRAQDAVKPVITPDAATKTQAVGYDTKEWALSWTVSDNHKVVAIVYNSLSIPVTATVKQTLNLGVGPTTATLVAIDSMGNKDSSVVVITRQQDAVKPVVTITKPAATSTVPYGTTSIDVTASATDAGSGLKSLTIGGKPAPLAGGAVSVALVAGKNVIKVVAIDNADNTATDSVVVTVASDDVGPVLTITSPVNNYEIPYPGTTVDVTATASDAASGLASIKIGATTCTSSPCTVKGVTPTAGKITVVATDSVGKSTTQSINVTVGTDKTAPVIKAGTGAVAEMVENGVTSRVVAWTVTDNGPLGAVTITNNTGAATTVTGTNGSYSSTVNLVEDDNKITINAKDAAGNSATALIFTVIRKYKVATPTFVTTARNVAPGTAIKLACATTSAVIKYTLGTATTEYTYDDSKGIAINADVTITAWATLTNNTTSDKTAATFTVFKPAATPVITVSGTYPKTVSITSATSDATIYYTTNGNAPTTSSTLLVGGSFTLATAGTYTVKAIAVKSGFTNSAVGSSAQFTVTEPDVTLKSVKVGSVVGVIDEVTRTVTVAPLTTIANSFSVTATGAIGATVSINGKSASEAVTLTDDAATVSIIVTNGGLTGTPYTMKLQLATSGILSHMWNNYSVKKIGTTWWMLDPLRSANDGYLTGVEARAPQTCPTGWRLPALSDWEALSNPGDDLGRTDGEFWTWTLLEDDPTWAYSWLFQEKAGILFSKASALYIEVDRALVLCIK